MATKAKSAPKKSVNIRPLGDRILVERVEAEERTAGGILLPESAKEKPKEGVVIAVGEGRVLDSGERSAPAVKKGDRVLFTSYAGTEVKYGGHEYLIMEERDILGVIED
jgi:chaperonin GroES